MKRLMSHNISIWMECGSETIPILPGKPFPFSCDFIKESFLKYYINGEACSSHIVNCDGYEQIKNSELTLCDTILCLAGRSLV